MSDQLVSNFLACLLFCDASKKLLVAFLNFLFKNGPVGYSESGGMETAKHVRLSNFCSLCVVLHWSSGGRLTESLKAKAHLGHQTLVSLFFKWFSFKGITHETFCILICLCSIYQLSDRLSLLCRNRNSLGMSDSRVSVFLRNLVSGRFQTEAATNPFLSSTCDC